MNRSFLLSLLATYAACGFAIADPVYTTPVGYVTIPIPGTNGLTPSRLQIASQQLLPSGSTQHIGTIDSLGSDAGGTFLLDATGT